MDNLIFLFSLPRSGSTLLQRMLASHQQIHSVSEPWILLPFFYALRSNGISAEYDTRSCAVAMHDFLDELPSKEDDFYKAVNALTHKLYGSVCIQNEKYFLDKTPRYYLIIPEIIKAFPDAKFIFLFRNPLAILSSICETWHSSRLQVHKNTIDLYQGPKLLAEGFRLLEKKSLALRYEDMLESPESELKKVASFLNIDYESDMLDDFRKHKLRGRLGDPGKDRHASLESGFADKWIEFFDTGFRQAFARRYLSSLDDDVIGAMGYQKESILKQLKSPVPNWRKTIFDYYYFSRSQWKIHRRGKLFK